MEKFEIEEKIVAMLKTVYDPEIPVNVYDLGLIYKIDVSDNGEVVLDMTLTAPNCPAADFIMEDDLFFLLIYLFTLHLECNYPPSLLSSQSHPYKSLSPFPPPLLLREGETPLGTTPP